jgi:hypothetical protein
MIKKFLFIISIILFSNSSIFTQTVSKYELLLKQKFEEFDYNSVIKLADSILINEKNLSRNDSLNLLYYKALSSFNIWDIKTSEQSFKSILNLDENFSLDTINVSPKIVSYFNDLKTKFSIDKQNKKQTSVISIDSILINERIKYSSQLQNYREALWRNLILPGWGNIYLRNETKGYLVATAFTLLLISSAYFIYDTYKKEKDYLSEINPDLISSKYSSYNASYKLRNISLGLSALIYIYSQIDYLLFEHSDIKSNSAFRFSFSFDQKSQFSASFSFPVKF